MPLLAIIPLQDYLYMLLISLVTATKISLGAVQGHYGLVGSS